jgi:hypothetical protein
MVKPDIALVFRNASEQKAALVNATNFDFECCLLRSNNAAAVMVEIHYSSGVIRVARLLFNLQILVIRPFVVREVFFQNTALVFKFTKNKSSLLSRALEPLEFSIPKDDPPKLPALEQGWTLFVKISLKITTV